ncbi:hypothetical protein, partial [Paenibacillus sonchi]|uniref:hypothetical protein n=1 Tax=Paenibacillus sonchi TaxID=373687 RepID=UPI001ADFE3E7
IRLRLKPSHIFFVFILLNPSSSFYRFSACLGISDSAVLLLSIKALKRKVPAKPAPNRNYNKLILYKG